MNTFETLPTRRPPRVRDAGWARQRGSALIEFPFAVLILMLLLLVVADLGRLTPWAQQVAYSADAGAQFAYRTYSYSPSSSGQYRNDTTDTDGLTFGEIEPEIEDHVRSAVPGLYDDNDPVEIEVTEILRWSCSDFSDGIITVDYYKDKDSSDCDEDEDEKEVVFIEVSVTEEFKPFSLFIDRIIPEGLREQTFTISRQIFP